MLGGNNYDNAQGRTMLSEADRHRAAEYELLELRLQLLREEKSLEIEKQRTLEAERLHQEAFNFTPVNLIIERNVDYLTQELEKERFESEQCRQREIRLLAQLQQLYEERERVHQCTNAQVVEGTKEVLLASQESSVPEGRTYSECPTASTLASCSNDDRDILSARAQTRFMLTPPDLLSSSLMRLPTIVSAPNTPQMENRDGIPGLNPTPRGTAGPRAVTQHHMTRINTHNCTTFSPRPLFLRQPCGRIPLSACGSRNGSQGTMTVSAHGPSDDPPTCMQYLRSCPRSPMSHQRTVYGARTPAPDARGARPPMASTTMGPPVGATRTANVTFSGGETNRVADVRHPW